MEKATINNLLNTISVVIRHVDLPVSCFLETVVRIQMRKKAEDENCSYEDARVSQPVEHRLI